MPQSLPPEKRDRKRLCRVLMVIVYLIAFGYFYYRYVPLIKPFQMVLAPVLICLFVLSSWKSEWGTGTFIVLFPLVNNLPYFFDIYENIPHAPTALVLFLAYLGGVLTSTIFRPFPPRISHRLERPLALFSLLIVVSGLITFLRYANFFPVLTDGIYEVIVNVNHVRAGGALMSVVFTSLNYITGFLLFYILLHFLSSPEHIRRLFGLLTFSSLISLSFAFIQRYLVPGTGNTPNWLKLQQINSTFKDPNSFGLFLCALAPIFLGLFLAGSRRSRLFYASLLVAALGILPATGTRIAFLALLISLLIFLLLSFLSSRWTLKKKTGISLALVLITAPAVLSLALLSPRSTLSQRLHWSFSQLVNGENLASVFTLRGHLWTAACLMVKDYPLTGVGIGGYIIELPNSLKLENRPFRKTDSAENLFLQVGAELGLIGFFLFLWLTVEIVKQMKGRWRSLQDRQENPFVLIGTISGISAIFISFLFHSYIGGFEAKYLFWTLLAILFARPGMSSEPGSQMKRRPLVPPAAIIVAVLFASLHTWHSLHGLSLPNRASQFGWPRDFGLYKPEKDTQKNVFRWTRRAAGFAVERPGPILALPLRASHPDIGVRPVRVEVFRADQRFRKLDKAGDITLRNNDWAHFEFVLPQRLDKELNLVLETDRTWQPFESYGVADSRSLAVALGREWFRYPDTSGDSDVRIGEQWPSSLWQGPSGSRLLRNGICTLDFRTQEKAAAIRLWARGQAAFGMGPYLVITCDGLPIARTMVNEEHWTPLFIPFAARPGPHRLTVEFINDISGRGQDRNVYLGDLETFYRP